MITITLGLLVVLTMILLIPLFTRRIRDGQLVYLRHIPALDSLPHLVSRAVESGQVVHVSLGTGGLTGATTATTLAGLAVLDYIAERGASSGVPPLVTVADPLVLPAAQDSVRRAYGRYHRPDAAAGAAVEMIAPQPTIYALGASTHLDPKETAANVMIGSFGPEALLLAEPGVHRAGAQIAGTDDPQAMAMLSAVSDDAVIGEEVFAMSAYLGRKPAHLASLQAQDVMRIGVIVLILIAALLRTMGVSLF